VADLALTQPRLGLFAQGALPGYSTSLRHWAEGVVVVHPRTLSQPDPTSRSGFDQSDLYISQKIIDFD
jgi:hypothetical protein